MNIVYGVTGEGLGHSSRSKEIISHLISKKNKILILTYGQAFPVMKENFNHSKLVEIYKIEGFHIEFKKERLSISKTIIKNFKPFLKNIKNTDSIKNKIKSFKPDLFITDFEPLTANASYFFRKPLISIDGQHRLTHLKIKIPKKYKKDFFIAKNYTKLVPLKANYYIILSFSKFEKKESKVFFVSPIIRKEILKIRNKTKEGRKILVYQTKKNKSLIDILKKIKEEKFLVYGHEKSKKEQNITYKKRGKGFLKDLANCKAIIGSAGFTLISESLFLKKPYLAIPLKGQFEQTLNAIFLKDSKLGIFLETPNQEEIEKFLKNLNLYKNNLSKYKTNTNEAIEVLEKILKKA